MITNTVIQIKRSEVNDTPAYLNIAEPGYSYTSNTLFIGTPDSLGTINIGGYFYTKTIDDSTDLPAGNTLVLRDEFGSASFNLITANIITSNVVGDVDGNANSATQLQSPFILSIEGDAEGNIAIDGATNVSLNVQLTPSGVIAGQYGNTTQIPTFDISDDGRIVSANTISISTELFISADSGANTVSLLTDILNIAGGDGITTEIVTDDTITIKVDETVIRTNPELGEQSITGRLNIYGDFYVEGNTITANTIEYKITDPILYLASDNYSSDELDIGFVANYNDGSTNRHAGVVRKANTNDFYIFTNYDEEFDTNTLDVDNPSLTLANVHANIFNAVIFESTIDCGTY